MASSPGEQGKGQVEGVCLGRCYLKPGKFPTRALLAGSDVTAPVHTGAWGLLSPYSNKWLPSPPA